MARVLLTIFAVTAGLGLAIYVVEWVHTRRLHRLTIGEADPPLRRRVADFAMVKATIDVFGHVVLMALPVLAMLATGGWVERDPARAAIALVVTTVPCVALVKAIIVRRRRKALVDETRLAPDYIDLLTEPYREAIWKDIPILIADLDTGLIAHASRAADRLFGTTAGALVNRSVDQLIPQATQLTRDRHHARQGFTESGEPLRLAVQVIPVLGNTRMVVVLAQWVDAPAEQT